MSFAELILWLKLAILRLILWFEQQVVWRTTSRRARDSTRTILLIGDGVAQGAGDRLGATGLRGQLIKQIRDMREQQTGLRLPWRIASIGQVGTKSDDWLPGSKLMRQSIIREAAVVVLLIGSHDGIGNLQQEQEQEEEEQVVINIGRIVESLLDEGKVVVVPGIPNWWDVKAEPQQYARAMATSAALKRHLEAIFKKYQTIVESNDQLKSVNLVIADADLAKVCAMGEDVFSREKTFVSFNARGYRIFGADLFDDVVKAAKKVEWVHWKKQLTSR